MKFILLFLIPTIVNSYLAPFTTNVIGTRYMNLQNDNQKTFTSSYTPGLREDFSNALKINNDNEGEQK